MDNNHKNCLLVRDHLRCYCGQVTPISCKIPDTFDEYWNKTIKGEARTEWHKAKERGYYLEVVKEAPVYEMSEIMKSWDSKQKRDVNLYYNTIYFYNLPTDVAWPISNYEPWCPHHNLELFVVRLKGKTVAYCEILNCDNLALVHATMAHKDYIKDSVMKFMFIEIARLKLGKILIYGTTNNLKDERKHFVNDLGITKPYVYSNKEIKPTIVLDFDDLEIGRGGLEEIIQIKEHFPKMKVTFFMVPIANNLINKNISIDEYKTWAKWLRDQDWIEICPHGMTHGQSEMKYYPNSKRLIDYETANLYIDAVEHTFKQLELPYKKIWKSPYWETSPQAYKALWDRGYTIAVDPNQDVVHGGPIYTYNWSIDDKRPDYSILKGHGHMYPPSKNAVQYCLNTLLSLPTDAYWRFVSDILL